MKQSAGKTAQYNAKSCLVFGAVLVFCILSPLEISFATPPAPAGVSLLDDASNINYNNWQQTRMTGAGANAGTMNLAFLEADNVNILPWGNKSYSIQLSYYAGGEGQYSYFINSLGAGDIDLSAYNYMSFWIRGQAGGEDFQVGLGNTAFVEPKVRVSQFLAKGITTQWQKVVIPFQVLENISTWTRSSANKFVIVADGNVLGSKASGTVFIDDITFGTATAPVWVDNFNDGANPNALNENNDAYGTNVNITYNNSIYTSAPYSLACEGLAGSQGTFVHRLGGLDIQYCTDVVFDARGEYGTENDVQLRLVSQNGPAQSIVWLHDYATLNTTEFITVRVPLAAAFPTLDLTQMSECNLDYVPGDARKVYVDNLRFDDNSMPAPLTTMTYNGAPVYNGMVIDQSGVVAVQGGSLAEDPKMEKVMFDYAPLLSEKWTTLADDYAVQSQPGKNNYSADWDLSKMNFGGSYKLRATAFHVGGPSSSHAYTVTVNVTPVAGFIENFNNDSNYLDSPDQRDGEWYSYNSTTLQLSMAGIGTNPSICVRFIMPAVDDYVAIRKLSLPGNKTDFSQARSFKCEFKLSIGSSSPKPHHINIKFKDKFGRESEILDGFGASSWPGENPVKTVNLAGVDWSLCDPRHIDEIRFYSKNYYYNGFYFMDDLWTGEDVSIPRNNENPRIDNFDNDQVYSAKAFERDATWMAPDTEVYTFSMGSGEGWNNSSYLKVQYNKPAGRESAFICADNLNFPGKRTDFSNAAYLSMQVYGSLALLIKFEDCDLDSSGDSEILTVVNPTGWTTIQFNLANINWNQCDPTRIKKILLFPQPGQTGSGEFYIDDLALVGDGQLYTITPTPSRTITPTPSITRTPTPVVTATATCTMTDTFTPTPVVSATPTLTSTPTLTATPSSTISPTATMTSTITLSPTLTITLTPSSAVANITQVGFWDNPGWGQDVDVVGDFAYLADGNSGLRILDVSSPSNPYEIGSNSGFYAYAIQVVGQYAYVANYLNNLVILDISNPTQPSLIGSVSLPDYTWAVQVVGDYAYVADWTDGLRIVNIANPNQPFEVGHVDTPYSARELKVAGRYAYVADGQSGLRIIDVSNPAAPVEVGFYDTPGNANGVALKGHHALVTDEDGLAIIDISNPNQPSLDLYYQSAPPIQYIAIEIQGNYAYIKDCQKGLHILEISLPENPIEVGVTDWRSEISQFDVVGNYVYFPEAIQGFKVLEVTWLQPTATISGTAVPTWTVTPTHTPEEGTGANVYCHRTSTRTATPTPSAEASPSSTPTLTPTQVTSTHTPTVTVTTTPTKEKTATRTCTATPSREPLISTSGKPVIAYPNPARGKMNFAWRERDVETVRIEIYSMSGELVSVITDNNPHGNSVSWLTENISPGIYIYRVLLDVQGKQQIQHSGRIAIVQ